MSRNTRPEDEPGSNEFRQMIESHTNAQRSLRQKVKPPAQRIRQRLSFKMVIERCEIKPGWISTQLDESRAQHHSKDQPAKKPNNGKRRFAFGKRASIKQRAEEYGKKTGFQQLDFPTVTIPILAKMDDRHIKGPQDRERKGVRMAASTHQ